VQDLGISPFVQEWLPRIVAQLDGLRRPRRALDLAMGTGRHAVALSRAGFLTYGVDRDVARLLTARRAAHLGGLTVLQWAADLDDYPLPLSRFDLLVCTRFLARRRWHDIKASVAPGGFVMYETFTVGQIARGYGPSSPDHLLEPGELGHAFADWKILHSEEVADPAAMARLVARKPAGPRPEPWTR
jgi:tellurite methyltransferase